ncbi:ECF RNA polymerase sigma factor SigW [Anatilimnocola aggregata]|uniref:ECF RNA polymerase sigma factor SigW n=1 Tax=Anatilimnocola aggregata TaxID=2528021 RepID=A0A517YCH0_9BACT|nr:RNA polymerase sigma factor [Anatilimnocola aggregata]QDU27933.1 ECF RNA polymerase sigma factor SigW [Anatilimnocola aggregata]
MESSQPPARSMESAALVLGTAAHGREGGNESPSDSVCAAGVEPHHGLVMAAQRGDQKAFTALVEFYQQTVFGYLRARLFDSTDAEDLCQETFLRCYQGREKLSRATQVGPWLIGIARNLLREHVKRITRRREVAWTELCLELDQMVQERVESSSDVLQGLPICMESLGPSARQAIDLRYRAQLKMAEIANTLRRSEGAVRLLVHRARLALKQCLDNRLKGSE